MLYKMILKLDKWLMQVQNFFEYSESVYGGRKWFWVIIFDLCHDKIILKLEIDWCKYKTVLQLGNLSLLVQSNSETW